MKILVIFCLMVTLLSAEEKRSKYFIAIKKNEDAVLDTLTSYIPLLPPKGKFYADPILFKHKGVNYIFFEDFDYKKGIISYVRLDDKGHFSSPQKALELPIHLSFPHVFEEGGEIYMTPETYDAHEVALFRARSFPNEWEKVRVLIKGAPFADPILFKHNGYYWLFTAVSMDKLCIYYAPHLEAEFKPHPINYRHVLGRNAGQVYQTGGRLIRPTMDCRGGYGKSMILKEILVLDPYRFQERELFYIGPNWAPHLDGTHTYSQNEDFVVYDGRRTIFLSEDGEYSAH